MTPLELYVGILDELLWRRAVHWLDEEEEERFAVALNDCRRAMSREEEERIARIVEQRKSTKARDSLGLEDLEVPDSENGPLRRTAA